MTSDERQALREKHKLHKVFTHVCDGCSNHYPCDVIKVLDATEPEVPINWAAGK